MGIDLSKIKRVDATQKPTSSVSKISELLNKDIQLFGSGLSDQKKESFYLELGTLLSAGLDIKATLELIAGEQKKEKDKKLFENIKEQIVSGASLSETLQNTGQFSPYEYFTVQIGEESGRTTEVLLELTEYFHSKIKLKRQITSALTYPAIILSTSGGVLLFMMNFVVPMFSDIFKRFGGELPYITQVILNISNALKDYFFIGFIGVIIFVVMVISQKKNESFRRVSSGFLLRVPMIGGLIRKIYLARFCNSMALLLGSKVSITRALSLVKQMIGFYPIEASIAQIESDIMKGESMHKSFAAHSIYYSKMISLIKVGEEVNQLELFFSKMSKQYSDDVEHETSLISRNLEPVLLIFLGLIVGVILVAMYLPLFKLGTAFS